MVCFSIMEFNNKRRCYCPIHFDGETRPTACAMLAMQLNQIDSVVSLRGLFNYYIELVDIRTDAICCAQWIMYCIIDWLVWFGSKATQFHMADCNI